MKQYFSFLFCILSVLAFCACNSDIEVQDNQMYFNGQTYEMSVTGATYTPHSKTYHIKAKNPQTRDWHFGLMADTSLVGKKIDLANIDPVLLANGAYLQCYIYYNDGGHITDFIGYYALSVAEGVVGGIISGDTMGEEYLYYESPFKEGSLLITNDGSYFKLDLNGTLKNGKQTAVNIVVPVNDIRIITPMQWNQS